jgi:hypothetical protein
MNKYKNKNSRMVRIVCLILAIGMVLSALASGLLSFF